MNKADELNAWMMVKFAIFKAQGVDDLDAIKEKLKNDPDYPQLLQMGLEAYLDEIDGFMRFLENWIDSEPHPGKRACLKWLLRASLDIDEIEDQIRAINNA